MVTRQPGSWPHQTQNLPTVGSQSSSLQGCGNKCLLFNLCAHVCFTVYIYIWASQVALVVKNPPAKGRDKRDPGFIPGLQRSPGGGHGNPLQCSCLENPMDRGAWWVTVYGVAKSRTRLKSLNMHTYTQRSGWDGRLQMDQSQMN